MKKSPASKKGETYVVSGSRKSKEGKTTKVYRKDGSLKSERTIKDSGTKKEARYTASPRTLTTKKKQVDVKDPATRSYTKYKKDGTVKKSITEKEAANKRGTGVDLKVSGKVDRKIRRDKRGAKNMTFKQDQRKDVDVNRAPAKLKKSPTKMKKSPSKLKSPAKKPLVGKQKNLPEHLKKAILDAPAKMLSKSGMKMMKEGSPVKIESRSLKKTSAPAKDVKGKKTVTPKRSKTIVKNIEKKMVTKKGVKTGSVNAAKAKRSKANAAAAKKQGYMMNYNTGQFEPTPNKRGAERRKAANLESPSKMKAPMKKSKQRVEQDYARNAIADYKAGKRKQGNYEKKKALELAAGESGVMMKKNSPGMMKNPMMMKTNQSGGGYAAKNPAAPARQLKKLGSILSKHMKSN